MVGVKGSVYARILCGESSAPDEGPGILVLTEVCKALPIQSDSSKKPRCFTLLKYREDTLPHDPDFSKPKEKAIRGLGVGAKLAIAADQSPGTGQGCRLIPAEGQGSGAARKQLQSSARLHRKGPGERSDVPLAADSLWLSEDPATLQTLGERPLPSQG
ncbi:hypothetical protein TREES_T100000716 [Tupaia chinensis]|uniref:Uncharacterized protein n=1 Tax=Tupaia chinensis TaxID=246437 RepID=L9KLG1_TUPCH|nr:hypothetical protein TREES_T100000716 [Tupaia chinensis]